MKSRFQIGGHPVHAMLVAYPIGLYVTSLLCDFIYLWRGDPFWYRMAFWSMLIGFIGHLAAAVPGFVDYLAIAKEAPNAQRTATMHLGLGLTLAILYLINLFIRRGGGVPEGGSVMIPILLSLIGTGLLGLQGWFGGELVYKHAIGVSLNK
jgi:uncharacterized membrane protein